MFLQQLLDSNDPTTLPRPLFYLAVNEYARIGAHEAQKIIINVLDNTKEENIKIEQLRKVGNGTLPEQEQQQFFASCLEARITPHYAYYWLLKSQRDKELNTITQALHKALTTENKLRGLVQYIAILGEMKKPERNGHGTLLDYSLELILYEKHSGLLGAALGPLTYFKYSEAQDKLNEHLTEQASLFSIHNGAHEKLIFTTAALYHITKKAIYKDLNDKLYTSYLIPPPRTQKFHKHLISRVRKL